MLEQVSSFLLYLALISVAAERFTEILKRTIVDRFKVNKLKGSLYQIIAALFGMFMAFISPHEVTFLQMNEYLQIILVGLAVSGGSGFWNGLLTILNDFGKQRTGI